MTGVSVVRSIGFDGNISKWESIDVKRSHNNTVVISVWIFSKQVARSLNIRSRSALYLCYSFPRLAWPKQFECSNGTFPSNTCPQTNCRIRHKHERNCVNISICPSKAPCRVWFIWKRVFAVELPRVMLMSVSEMDRRIAYSNLEIFELMAFVIHPNIGLSMHSVGGLSNKCVPNDIIPLNEIDHKSFKTINVFDTQQSDYNSWLSFSPLNGAIPIVTLPER